MSGNPRKFNRAEAFQMIKDGQKQEVVALHFGVSRIAVLQGLKKEGRPTSAKAYRKAKELGEVAA